MVGVGAAAGGSFVGSCTMQPETFFFSGPLSKNEKPDEQLRPRGRTLLLPDVHAASGNGHRKKGFVLRPWKGPLPKRRALAITLEAYFPEIDQESVLHPRQHPVAPIRPSREVLIASAGTLGGPGGT